MEEMNVGYERRVQLGRVKKVFLIVMAVAALLASSWLLLGCYEPSPLYGSWADNSGNKISFINDGTFVAKIKSVMGTAVSYEGDYSVIDNVLVFSVKDPSYTVTTEWDIRGAMLYLEWLGSDKQTVSLTLYHTAR